MNVLAGMRAFLYPLDFTLFGYILLSAAIEPNGLAKRSF
jgi:hypothetical protein